jgi:hypothetical protein
MNNEENIKLEAFEKWRKETIDLLSENKIDKNEFLEMNHDYLRRLDLKPFSMIEQVNQGIFNYQYYNIMAKISNVNANNLINNHKKRKQYKKYINDRENFYYLKDLATDSILKLISYKNLDCYYIELLSKRLTGQIFEIVLLDYENVVLHSKNKKILNKLIENDAFDNRVRKSVIDDYVNRSYYI